MVNVVPVMFVSFGVWGFLFAGLSWLMSGNSRMDKVLAWILSGSILIGIGIFFLPVPETDRSLHAPWWLGAGIGFVIVLLGWLPKRTP